MVDSDLLHEVVKDLVSCDVPRIHTDAIFASLDTAGQGKIAFDSLIDRLHTSKL